MAVTLGQLAVALRLQTSPTATPSDAYESILERLLAVGGALVETFGASAPEAIKDEATVRVAAYLFDQPNAGIRANYGAAWSNSGAAALVAPWSSRRAMPLAAGTPAAAGAGVDEAAVNRLIAAYVAAWAAADSTAPVPSARLEEAVQHAADQVPKLTTLVEDIELDENRTWRQTLDADGKFTWSRSRPADAAAAAALPDYANSRQNQPAVDAVDPALAFYWLTARIPAERSIADYRYRQHQGGHHGFIYDATGHDLGESGGFHYWSVQFLLLSGNSTSLEYDELESTSTTYAGKLADGIVTLASLAAEVLAAISGGGGGGGALLDGSVTTAKLANNAVTTAKLAGGAVSTTKLAGVVRERLAPALSGGTARQIIALNAAATALEFVDPPAGTAGVPPNDSVGTLQLQDLAVTSQKIAADAVSAAKIVAGAIGTSELEAAILARIAPALTSGTAGQFLRLNSGRTALEFAAAPSGGGGGGGGAGSVGTSQLADNAVTGDKIASDAVTTRHYAPVSIRDDFVSSSGFSSRVIQNAAITAAKLADHAVENAKLHASVNARMAPLAATGTGAIGGEAGQYLALNSDENAIEFVTPPTPTTGGATRTTLFRDDNGSTGHSYSGASDWRRLFIGTDIAALTGGELEFAFAAGSNAGGFAVAEAGGNFRMPASFAIVRVPLQDFRDLDRRGNTDIVLMHQGSPYAFPGISLVTADRSSATFVHVRFVRYGSSSNQDVLVETYSGGRFLNGTVYTGRHKVRVVHIG